MCAAQLELTWTDITDRSSAVLVLPVIQVDFFDILINKISFLLYTIGYVFVSKTNVSYELSQRILWDLTFYKDVFIIKCL